jgi:hypothetical protein
MLCLLFVGRAEDFPILLVEWLPMFGVNCFGPKQKFTALLSERDVSISPVY